MARDLYLGFNSVRLLMLLIKKPCHRKKLMVLVTMVMNHIITTYIYSLMFKNDVWV